MNLQDRLICENKHTHCHYDITLLERNLDLLKAHRNHFRTSHQQMKKGNLRVKTIWMLISLDKWAHMWIVVVSLAKT